MSDLTEAVKLLQKAAAEIRWQRERIEILESQLDLAWKIDCFLKQGWSELDDEQGLPEEI